MGFLALSGGKFDKNVYVSDVGTISLKTKNNV